MPVKNRSGRVAPQQRVLGRVLIRRCDYQAGLTTAWDRYGFSTAWQNFEQAPGKTIENLS